MILYILLTKRHIQFDTIYSACQGAGAAKRPALDFGSGLGVSANYFAAWHDVTAVEPNEEMIDNKQGENAYTQIKGGIEKTAGFEDKSFDIVFCHNVLE